MGERKGACSLFSLEERTASAFREYASYLELQGESSFKIKAYLKAAKSVSVLDLELAHFAEQGTVESIPGIGKALAEKISQLYRNGSIRQLEVFRDDYGPGLLEVMSLPGLGAKKTLFLHSELGVRDLDSFAEALRSGSVASLKGFSVKSQEKLLAAVECKLQEPKVYLKSHLEDWAQTLSSTALSWPEVSAVKTVGTVRRLCPVGERLELLLCSPSIEDLKLRLSHLGGDALDSADQSMVKFLHPSGCPIWFHLCPEFPSARTLVRLTGPSEYWERVRAELGELSDENLSDEAPWLSTLDLPYLPPELRHREELWTTGLSRELHFADMGGSFHNHTTASDGSHSILEMSQAAKELGHRFLGISDHSRSLTIAGGLSEEELLAQNEDISQLREETHFLGLFSSTECDILADGSLDYPPDTLARLDYVVVAVHSHFQQSKSDMTARLLRGIDSSKVRILAHPTGRILTGRAGYEADWETVFTKCRELKVAVEINASPWRLDVSEELLDLAVELGCLLAVSPDAHSMQELRLLRHGYDMLLRSKAQPEQIVNLWSLADLRAWFEKGSAL